MRISDWSSDVCSSDLRAHIFGLPVIAAGRQHHAQPCPDALCACTVSRNDSQDLSVLNDQFDDFGRGTHLHAPFLGRQDLGSGESSACAPLSGFQMALEAGADMLSAGLHLDPFVRRGKTVAIAIRSEEHTSELPSLMRISYAVF